MLKDKQTMKSRQKIRSKSVSEDESRGQRKKRQKENRKGNRQIIAIAYCCVAVFLCLIGYIAKFMVVDSQNVINNPYNKRQELLAERVIRGNILSADGKILARTVTDSQGNESRSYPYGRGFCHVVGRTTNSKTGIEQAQSFPLLTSHSNPLAQLVNQFKGEKNQGDNVVTTLDADLQQVAYDALGSHKGAVIAMEPSTGKILAMVSKPDYDPNAVAENWSNLIEDSDDDSALLNRATQGLYPPGSTFKLMTAMEYIKEQSDYKSYRYTCNGSGSFDGVAMKCYGSETHGRINLKQSMAESCNCSFANIGLQLSLNSFSGFCNSFGFNRALPVDFEYNKSKFILNSKSTTDEVVQTAIGQGKTMITPLQNALISATIANHGEMMVPYLVDHTENSNGQTIKTYKPESNGKIISPELSQTMTQMMKAVVNDGTATSLNTLSYKVAGKTGTAEFDSEGTSHAWFVGFASTKNPKLVVSVVVEGAGTGSQYAVPMAKRLFQEYLGN